MATETNTMTPKQLKTLRASLGLTQSQLAEAIGVASNTVTRWEMGRHPISSPIIKLLRTLRKKAVP